MVNDDTPTIPDPSRDPQTKVPLTRADIPELVKAVVATVAGTPKLPGKLVSGHLLRPVRATPERA